MGRSDAVRLLARGTLRRVSAWRVTTPRTPRPSAGRNKPAGLQRRKPSRWCETTRTEHDIGVWKPWSEGGAEQSAPPGVDAAGDTRRRGDKRARPREEESVDPSGSMRQGSSGVASALKTKPRSRGSTRSRPAQAGRAGRLPGKAPRVPILFHRSRWRVVQDRGGSCRVVHRTAPDASRRRYRHCSRSDGSTDLEEPADVTRAASPPRYRPRPVGGRENRAPR
jgi:hypothetical protein